MGPGFQLLGGASKWAAEKTLKVTIYYICKFDIPRFSSIFKGKSPLFMKTNSYLFSQCLLGRFTFTKVSF